MDAFVTLQEYQAATQQELSGLQASAVEQLLEAASDDVRDYLNQTLDLVEDDVFTVDGTGTRALILPQLPVVRVNSVTVDGVAVTDYRVSPDGVLYRTADCWPTVWPWLTLIVVNYDHGYPEMSSGESTIPNNIKRVVIALAKSNFDAVGQTPGIISETIGGYSYTRSESSTLQQQQADILATLAKRIVRQVPVA